MAKALIIWNEHPGEVVAGLHARRVTKILKEKYGHDVKIEKIPYAKTNFAMVRKNTNPKQLLEEINKLPDSAEVAKHYAKKHDRLTFNFHSSSYKRIAEPAFVDTDEKTYYLVEVPAVDVPLPKRIRESNEEKRKTVKAHFNDIRKPKTILSRWFSYWFPTTTPEDARTSKYLNYYWPAYHETYAPIKEKIQGKYVSEDISNKIAEKINAVLTKNN